MVTERSRAVPHSKNQRNSNDMCPTAEEDYEAMATKMVKETVASWTRALIPDITLRKKKSGLLLDRMFIEAWTFSGDMYTCFPYNNVLKVSFHECTLNSLDYRWKKLVCTARKLT